MSKRNATMTETEERNLRQDAPENAARIAAGNAAERHVGAFGDEHVAYAAVEAATQALVDAQPAPVDQAVYETRRFEAFKLDLYRVLYRHKYTLQARWDDPNEPDSASINASDVGNLSRMKRQLAQAGCIESMVMGKPL